ncbi:MULTISPECIES: cytochrome c oxidase subunit 2A [Brevibacillus]|uniref:cytochrome c oxidase subunit 2A n=1 Tax=Brevibacillus TaxID=55080 RepID=UPI000E2EF0E6|nr:MULTISPECIES: cytochrome c oxidase subunit 2A [Brevibacillus]RFB34658.1 cytochrome c oxidase subunit 2A [Brevibacillus sp. VP]
MNGSQTQPNQKEENKQHQEGELNLKGTLASVFLVGLFIAVTWFAVFGVFLSRG